MGLRAMAPVSVEAARPWEALQAARGACIRPAAGFLGVYGCSRLPVPSALRARRFQAKTVALELWGFYHKKAFSVIASVYPPNTWVLQNAHGKLT